MPHGGVTKMKMPNRTLLRHIGSLDYVIRGGRALVMPVWLATLERVRPPARDPERIADRQRRAALTFYEDAATTIDYLETRPDVNAQRVGFIGMSFGVAVGVIPLAIDDRFAAAVLISGGVAPRSTAHPMIAAINYVPRVRIPVLMVNGRFDHIFLYETWQKPMYDLLGSPVDRKQHLVFDTGHFDFPRNQVARAATDWFDRFLGATR